MKKQEKVPTREQLLHENEELKSRLSESQHTLNAFRNMHEDILSEKGVNIRNNISSLLDVSLYQAFFEKIDECAFILSYDGIIIYSNPYFARLMNTPYDQIIGRGIDFYISKSCPITFSTLKKNNFENTAFNNISIQPEGNVGQLFMRLTLIPLSGKETPGDIGVLATDVSEYKQIEDKLREAGSTLEKRVAERTANLALANEELVKARIATLSMMGDTVEVMNELEITNSKLLEEIAERKRSKIKLEEVNEELRALTSRIFSIREQERTALSREIHDELGSALTGLKMDLVHIKHSLPGGEQNPEFVQTHELLASMVNTIDATIRMIRKIITDLRPEILDEVGLPDALLWYAGEFEKRTGISVQFTFFPKKFTLGKNQSTELFRIFQEILSNILRHSGAVKVVVFLKKEKQLLTLRVKDDGIGIKESDMANKNSFGIIGIRERTHLMKGHMSIKGAEGRGTTISIELPVAEEETD